MKYKIFILFLFCSLSLTAQNLKLSIAADLRISTTALDYSPDGKFLVTGGYNVVVNKVLPDGDLKSIYEDAGWTEMVTSVDFSPSGKYFVVAAFEKLKLYSFADGKITQLGQTAGLFMSVALNDSYLAAVSYDGFLYLFDISSGKLALLKKKKVSDDALSSVVMPRSGQYLLAGGYGGYIYKISLPQLSLISKTEVPYAINKLAYSPGEKYLAVGYENGVSVYSGGSLSKPVYQDRIDGGTGGYALAFSPDNKLFAYSLLSDNTGESTVRLVSLENFRIIDQDLGIDGFVSDCKFSPDNGNLVTVGDNGVLTGYFISYHGFSEVKTVVKWQPWLSSCVFSSDGHYLAISSDNGVLNILRTGSFDIAVHREFDRVISSVAYSHDGKLLLVGFSEGQIEVLDNSSNSIKQLQSVQFPYLGVSNDDRYLVASGDAGYVDIFDIKNGYKKVFSHKFDYDACGLAFSPDNKFVVLSSGTVISLGDFTVLSQNQWSGVEDVEFDKYGNIWTSGEDGLNVYSFVDGKAQFLQSYDVCDDVGGDISFSPDGNYLAMLCDDSGLKIFSINMLNLTEIYRKPLSAITYYYVGFSPSGKYLVLGGEPGALVLNASML